MIALVMVGLVAGQTEMAPVACLEGSTGRDVNSSKLALNASMNRVYPIAVSTRTDIANDQAVAKEILDIGMPLWSAIAHFVDMAEIGFISSEKKVRQKVLTRLVLVLGRLRLEMDRLAKMVTRAGDSITLPVLANEARELVGILDALEKQLAVCVVQPKLPAGAGAPLP